MAEPSKLRQVFPKGVSPEKEKKRRSSIGDKGKLGYSLNDNDPETLKFIHDKHPITDHGDRENTGAFKVATKYSLDDKKNERLKGHGKDKERDVYEENEIDEATCPKCGANCKCKDKSQGEPAYKKDKALLLGGKKIREDTLANRIAMDILEARKGKVIGKTVDKIDMGNPKFPKTVKGSVKEGVKLSNQHDTHDTDFPTGPAVGKAAEGETQGHHKPDGPTSNKSKKLVKTDTKKPATFNEGLFSKLSSKKAEKSAEKKEEKPKEPKKTEYPGYKGDERYRIMETKPFKEGSQSEPGENQIAEEDKVEKTMHEFKHGTLHSGSKTGPKVTNRKQAIAIALNQKRKAQHEDVNAVEPLLGEDGKKKKSKKKNVKEGGMPADVPVRYTNVKSDTGFAL